MKSVNAMPYTIRHQNYNDNKVSLSDLCMRILRECPNDKAKFKLLAHTILKQIGTDNDRGFCDNDEHINHICTTIYAHNIVLLGCEVVN